MQPGSIGTKRDEVSQRKLVGIKFSEHEGNYEGCSKDMVRGQQQSGLVVQCKNSCLPRLNVAGRPTVAEAGRQ